MNVYVENKKRLMKCDVRQIKESGMCFRLNAEHKRSDSFTAQ